MIITWSLLIIMTFLKNYISELVFLYRDIKDPGSAGSGKSIARTLVDFNIYQVCVI